MKQETIIQVLIKLGELFEKLGKNESWNGYQIGLTENEYSVANELIVKQKFINPWFTEESVRNSLTGISTWLHKDILNTFVSTYSFTDKPKNVLLVMAGNIPMVGFHDFICVILSGNKASCKLSSDDQTLLPFFTDYLCTNAPELSSRISFVAGNMKNIDAVIATGSNNSMLHFKDYFGKYPHIFRKNRTSVAVLTGEESNEELHELGGDIFKYFGLGCRNVTYLLVKEDFNLNRFFENVTAYGDIINHHKYANNYDYNRVVYLMNSAEMLDNNFVLLRESDELFGPLSMIHYKRWKDKCEVENFINKHDSEIQVVVGKNHLPFGKAQQPTITDFADNVDTMKFLELL